MCGICGVYSPSALPDVELGLAMMGELSHRGPDGSGYLRDETVLLGHTRLAIIDEAGGTQPMSNEDRTVWVVFNGEIFNHVELRAELERRGHRFRSRSDTEAIVHAWEEWGHGCFERFNGQWAVAIWDRRSRELILSRDRLGVRPLYYTRVGGRLLFASEVKALFADAEVPRRIDPLGLDEVLTFWSTVAPRTIFEGVKQVPPGSSLIVSERGETLRRHWRPSFPERGAEPKQDLVENVRELREAVVAATRLRFERADVPVGAYLSGGIDSAVTAASIAEYTGAELHTFSLRFADAEFDEGSPQAVMVDRLGSRHSEVVATERDIAEVFPEVVRHAETALLRTAPAPMYLLSKLVRDSGYKVVVTGEGADEVLAGYDIFREARVRRFLARNPDSEVRGQAVELLYPWMKRSPGSTPAFARSFFSRTADVDDVALSHRPRWESTSVLKSMLTADARVDAAAPDEALVAALGDEGAGWDPLAQAQWLELTTLLPGYILSSQGDRMLMANSIEGRFPFLDANLVELASRLPARQKMRGLDEKHLLKQAFADLVPTAIRERPKQPYRAPDAASFFADGSPDWLDDVASQRALVDAGVFRPEIVDRLLAKCRARDGRGLGNTDNMRLVAVLSVQLLSALFLGARPSAPRRPPGPVVAFDLVGDLGQMRDGAGAAGRKDTT
ncbi:asparagine synthase (glutamine-hydrolyzing) [Microbacterium oryzae]|uniref:asparagine synthase (glutamine-hydrolyzing) n=1 Tax=Microbacterium oryzae TaxID=743009 RepID=A0A6I6E124_9MICO|nr:asparagine synthase (glutamine-hydrolyzing) [Microbacterium oryzae]QGU27824.1 asparagine synthase (glutamine-hydrolyzing) [Microbacterium oryzae]